MFAFCPLVIIEKDGCIPARLEKINPEFRQYGRGHIEQVETLADVCERLGAINEYGYGACTDDIVVSVRPVTNVSCGGDVKYQVLIAKQTMHRFFDRYQTRTVYLSDDNGTLRVAIPA